MNRTLRAKILPPKTPDTYVPRGALPAGALEHRLTTVVAGPGYGKSTLLGAWAATVPCAWYTIDRDDVSPAQLATGLGDALRRVVPELPSIPGSAASASEGGFGRVLAEALEDEVDGGLVLVLDDLHELGRRGRSVRLVESLLRLAPASVHLVLASRAEPPFSIERLRGQGEVLALDAEALAFSVEEVEALVANEIGGDAVRLAPALFERTAGWPAAVRLSVEMLRTLDPNEREPALSALAQPGRRLYRYMTEEVFRRGPRGMRLLVERLAPLERFTPELCDYLGVADSGETLGRLKTQGLFLEPRSGPGGWFALHALVREVALERASASDTQLAETRRRAAEWFERHGHLAEALRLHSADSDGEAIVRLLLEHGQDVISAGAFATVLEVAERIPAELRERRVEQVIAQARMTHGDLDGALAGFERAAAAFDEVPAGLAWRLGIAHALRQRWTDALAAYGRASVETASTFDEAMVLAFTAQALVKRGDVAEARRLGEAVLEWSVRLGESTPEAEAHIVLALVAHRTGAPISAEAHLAAALEAAERGGNVLCTCGCRCNRAWFFQLHGRPAEALAECAAAPSAEEVGPLMARWLLTARGWAQLGLGQLDAALSDLQASQRLLQSCTNTTIPWNLLGIGEAHLLRGALSQARSAYEDAVASAEQGGDVAALALGLSGLSLAIAPDDDEQASALGKRAVALAPAERRDAALLAEGWIALRRGETERAQRAATTAAVSARAARRIHTEAEALELEAVSTDDPTRQARLLEEALAIWQDVGNELAEARVELARSVLFPGGDHGVPAAAAERRLRRLGVLPAAATGAPGLLATLPRPELPPITVRTLGSFHVLRKGRPLVATDWQSRKARDLLKILLARRGHATPRELLMEALWPEQDPKRLANRLSVALTTLRGVLDPERHFRPDHFLVADRSAVGLDLSHLPVDLESFLLEANTGLELERQGRLEEAVDLLSAAEERYTGDFLEEDLYEDWASPLREEARSTYIAVARALAAAAAANADYDRAVRYSLQILERDRYAEDAHLRLVSTLVAASRHGDARRHYATYASRMGEIGVEPAPFPPAAQMRATFAEIRTGRG